MPENRRMLPGLGLLVLVGLVARVVSIGIGVNHLIVAIALGIVLANTWGLPGWAERGVETRTLLLETGIVVLGSQLVLEVTLRTSAQLLGYVVGMILFTIVLTEVVARHVFDMERKLGSLIAAGSSICGVSAIVAVSGGIRANERQIAYAATTILIFDTLTVFLYPFLGDLLDLPGRIYGVWAGLSMFSTGPVIAAGFAHSEIAGQWATVTKVTRNLFIAGAAVGYSLYYAQKGTGDFGVSVGTLWEKFPKFLFGFLAFMALANTGVFSSAQIASLESAYKWLFLLAFAGFGLAIKGDDLRTAGPWPVLLVLLVFTIVSVVSLLIVSTFSIGWPQ